MTGSEGFSHVDKASHSAQQFQFLCELWYQTRIGHARSSEWRILCLLQIQAQSPGVEMKMAIVSVRHWRKNCHSRGVPWAFRTPENSTVWLKIPKVLRLALKNTQNTEYNIPWAVPSGHETPNQHCSHVSVFLSISKHNKIEYISQPSCSVGYSISWLNCNFPSYRLYEKEFCSWDP